MPARIIPPQPIDRPQHLVTDGMSVPGKPAADHRARASHTSPAVQVHALTAGMGVVNGVKYGNHEFRIRNAHVLETEAAILEQPPLLRREHVKLRLIAAA